METRQRSAALRIAVGAGVLYPLVQGLRAERFWIGLLDGAVVVSLVCLATLAAVRLRADWRSPVGWGAAALVFAAVAGIRSL